MVDAVLQIDAQVFHSRQGPAMEFDRRGELLSGHGGDLIEEGRDFALVICQDGRRIGEVHLFPVELAVNDAAQEENFGERDVAGELMPAHAFLARLIVGGFGRHGRDHFAGGRKLGAKLG